MHVVCKECSHRIPVTGRPRGSTSMRNVQAEGVDVGDGGISFRRGGRISFGRGGSIGFGKPLPSNFKCPKCGNESPYQADEIKDD